VLQGNDSSPRRSWSSIIQSVKAPLGFYTLVAILIGEVILAIIVAQASYWLVFTGLALLVVLTGLVTYLAVNRPHALAGTNAPSAPNAKELIKAETKVQEIAQASSVSSELIDPKLVRFIPPLNPIQFKIIRFPDEIPPNYYKYPYVPTGMVIIYQIPFFLLPVTDSNQAGLGHTVIDLRPSAFNEPKSKNIEALVDKAKCIHMLISAGHGLRMDGTIQFLYKRIGYLRLIFKNGVEQQTDLILGKHLREWAFGNSTGLVTELDLSWSKPAWLSHDSTKRFDLLTIPITNFPKDLTSIDIVAEFEERHPNKSFMTPSIIVSAITVERAILEVQDGYQLTSVSRDEGEID
jgi:hypothetical protein